MKNLYLLVGFLGLSFASFAQNHLITPVSKPSNVQQQATIKRKSKVGFYKKQHFLKGPRAKNRKPWNRTGKWTSITKIASRKHHPKGPEAKNNPLGRKKLKSSKAVMRYLLFKKDPLLVSNH